MNELAKKDFGSTDMPYSIDLAAIDGDGAFACPKCGTVISPEDTNEDVYRIVNTTVMHDQLVELVIECGSCKSNIVLTGFEAAMEGVKSRH